MKISSRITLLLGLAVLFCRSACSADPLPAPTPAPPAKPTSGELIETIYGSTMAVILKKAVRCDYFVMGSLVTFQRDPRATGTFDIIFHGRRVTYNITKTHISGWQRMENFSVQSLIIETDLAYIHKVIRIILDLETEPVSVKDKKTDFEDWLMPPAALFEPPPAAKEPPKRPSPPLPIGTVLA